MKQNKYTSTSSKYLGIKFIKYVYDYTLKDAKLLLREIRTQNAGERIAMSVAELLSQESILRVLFLFCFCKLNIMLIKKKSQQAPLVTLANRFYNS